MTERGQIADMFCDKAGWGAARRAPLAGDASNRRYERLHHPDGRRAVLMDAPAERGEDVRPFVRIAGHLKHLGYSPPQILAMDEANGFLLLEDLGDALYARILTDAPQLEQTLYSVAIDLLSDLHQRPMPDDVAAFSPAVMTRLSAMAFEWYAPDTTGSDAFLAALETELTQVWPASPVLILRDYHAENLLWLPGRDGLARVGLLDFQDAMAGHPAYDLISLIEDARRDVSPELAQHMLARYVQTNRLEGESFAHAARLISVQRNLRILGIFAKLSKVNGKPHYIDLIPRVWGHLERTLRHPSMAGLAGKLDQDRLAPDAARLNALKQHG